MAPYHRFYVGIPRTPGVCALPAAVRAELLCVIDLLALLPTYIALLAPEMHALIDVQVLRLLRVFRVFKLTAYVVEYQSLGRELVASQRKILIFPVCRADDCSGDGDRDVCGLRPGQRVHQHSYFGVLGHYHHDHSRLWRYHPQNGLGAPNCIDDDAIGLGHAGGAHGHCHSRHECRPVPRAHGDTHLSPMPERRPLDLCSLSHTLRFALVCLLDRKPCQRRILMWHPSWCLIAEAGEEPQMVDSLNRS
jgi:hypothetical protein